MRRLACGALACLLFAAPVPALGQTAPEVGVETGWSTGTYLAIAAGVVGAAVVIDILSGGVLTGPLVALVAEPIAGAEVLLARQAATRPLAGLAGQGVRPMTPAGAGSAALATETMMAEAAVPTETMAGRVRPGGPLMGSIAIEETGPFVTEIDGQPMRCMQYTICAGVQGPRPVARPGRAR